MRMHEPVAHARASATAALHRMSVVPEVLRDLIIVSGWACRKVN